MHQVGREFVSTSVVGPETTFLLNNHSPNPKSIPSRIHNQTYSRAGMANPAPGGIPV